MISVLLTRALHHANDLLEGLCAERHQSELPCLWGLPTAKRLNEKFEFQAEDLRDQSGPLFQ